MPAGVSRSWTPVDTGARWIQPSASYNVTCWLLIETMAMIGSPASRGAVVSAGCARRVCLAAASPVSAISAAIAANITAAEGPQWCFVRVDLADINRFTIPVPVQRGPRP